MNETEAKKFIADEVSKLIWQRLGIIAALFGIANIIAFVVLLISIMSQAKSIAEQQVRTSAAQFASEKLDKFTDVTNAAKHRIDEFDSSYADLYKKVGETAAGLKLLQSNKQTLETSLSDLSTETTKLRASIETLKQSDVARVVQVIQALKVLPNEDLRTVVKAFTDVKPQIDAIRSELSSVHSDIANKVSQNKAYRIKSQLPPVDGKDWYASVHNYGDTGLKAGLSIEIKTLKLEDTEDQDWVFVAK